jgi:hypothetical protein
MTGEKRQTTEEAREGDRHWETTAVIRVISLVIL